MLVINCVIALITCFYGLKLKKIVLGLCIGYVGYLLATLLFSSLISNTSLLIVICVGIGLLLGIYSTKLYKLSAFLICFLLSFLIFTSVVDGVLGFALGVILGIVMGYLGIKFLKAIIIFLTSIYGSISFIDGINSLFSINNNTILLIGMLVLAFLGINYQYKTNKGDINGRSNQ